MDIAFQRPRVAQLVLRLYDRAVHPEFFDTLAVRRVERTGYRVTARITPAGHVLNWSDGRVHLSEVTAAHDQVLPERGVCLSHRFQGERTTRHEVVPGLRYLASLQVEVLPAELFLAFQDELFRDGRRKGLVHHARPAHRFGPSPLGVVIAEALPDGLSISAFHTFPDEYAVVKTQSLIEWRG